MRYAAAAFAIFACNPAAAVGQLVSERIHSEANGASTMCGITAEGALEFEAKVDGSGKYIEQADAGDRFSLFSSPDGDIQWVFAKSANAAYPLATCRELTSGPDGSLYLNRNMRCDDSREECDRAFLEFNALDEQVKQALQGSDRPKTGG